MVVHSKPEYAIRMFGCGHFGRGNFLHEPGAAFEETSEALQSAEPFHF